MKLYNIFLNISLEADSSNISYISVLSLSSMGSALTFGLLFRDQLWLVNPYLYELLIVYLVFQLFLILAAHQKGFRLRLAKADSKSAILRIAFIGLLVAHLSFLLAISPAIYMRYF